MNKTAIKNFAVAARIMLISAVKQRAFEYAVTDKDNDPNITSVNGRPLSNKEINQRKTLIDRIAELGYDEVMEEAAYTWFNRFIALRYMEVNGYLPTRIRVFTDSEGRFKPEILSEAMNLSIMRTVRISGENMDIEQIDREYVLSLLESQENEELFKYLLITQCNALNDGLPEMFEQIGGWTELLFPRNLLRDDSVIAKMISEIPEEDWKDQVQIIGWLYQYYNTEPKDKVFADLKKNVKITAANIPAATQLFTPDWIVRYMVENSLGRLWAEGHGKPEDADWKYYLEEAEQEESVRAELEKIRGEYRNIQPEDIKVIDPCMGSGHILVYAFDVLMQIYTSCGWSERDAAKSILRHNLYGLDIDRRAYQLAYFSVMMKARQYCRRIFTAENQPNLANFADAACRETSMLTGAVERLAKQFEFADTYGSLMTVETPEGLDDELTGGTLPLGIKPAQLEMMMKIAKILGQEYDVVCTNPPYMGGGNMNTTLADYIKKSFEDYKSDLFSAFVVKCTQLAKPTGYTGFLTPYVWMFIQSYEKLRSYIYSSKTIETLIQFEYSAFEEATVPICTFVLKNSHVNKNGCYFRLTDFRGGMEVQRQKTLEAIADHKCGFYYESNSENFSKIPGMPVAYWVSENFVRAFDESNKLGELFEARKGLATSDNNRFLKLWFEVSFTNIGFGCKSNNDCKMMNTKWYPHNKGGEYRKWYGNYDYVINWYNDGFEIRNYRDSTGKLLSRPQNTNYNFKQSVTWSKITSGAFSARFCEGGALFDDAAAICHNQSKNLLIYLLGFMNTNIAEFVLNVLNPTLNKQISDMCNLPIILDKNKESLVEEIVENNLIISKRDWDSFETSWDFEQHPLV